MDDCKDCSSRITALEVYRTSMAEDIKEIKQELHALKNHIHALPLEVEQRLNAILENLDNRYAHKDEFVALRRMVWAGLLAFIGAIADLLMRLFVK